MRLLPTFIHSKACAQRPFSLTSIYNVHVVSFPFLIEKRPCLYLFKLHIGNKFLGLGCLLGKKDYILWAMPTKKELTVCSVKAKCIYGVCRGIWGVQGSMSCFLGARAHHKTRMLKEQHKAERMRSLCPGDCHQPAAHTPFHGCTMKGNICM